MKRYWLLLVAMILAVGVLIFEEQHRAATLSHQMVNHIPPPELEAPRLQAPPEVRENNFADYAILWGRPPVNDSDPDLVYSSIMFQKDLAPAGAEKVLVRPMTKTDPVLTVQDREAAYAIYSSAGFKLTFNLKPAFATPEALLPKRVDPGIGGSFSF